MKTEIILCDKCKDGVARDVCVICNKDVCKNCYDTIHCSYGYDYALTFLKICKSCSGQIISMIKSQKHDKEKFKELLIKYLKNNLVLEELGK